MDDFDAVDATQDTVQPARRYDALRPVTIRQLAQTKIKEELTKTGSRFRYSLDGHDYSLATFVGNIVNVEIRSESTRSIRIEDGTGKITLNHMIQEAEEAEDPPRWRPGAYARVFGVPKELGRTTIFEIRFIRPVEDPHEVLFHLMEAIVVTLQHSRGRSPPRLYDSEFARTAGPPPHSQSQPLPVSSTSQVTDDIRGGSQDSVMVPSYPSREDTSDDGDGSSEYYTDQSPDSPLERSPSPTPMRPFTRNHSYEGHSDRGEGPSSQPMQRPKVQSGDEGDEEGQTPRGWNKLRRGDDSVSRSPKKTSDDELEFLRSQLSSQLTPSTPPRLKPDPYSGWSPAKRKIMVFVRSKTPGEEVNIKRSLGEGMSKMEMMNAVRELVKEGEIETIDGINYRLTDKGPNYPRF